MNLLDAVILFELSSSEISKKDVKSTYKRMMLKWHPDKHVGEEPIRTATAMAQKVNCANEVLTKALACRDPISNPLISSKPSAGITEPPPRRRPPEARSPYRSTYRAHPSRKFWNDEVQHGFPDETVFEVFFKSGHLVSGGYNAIQSILYQKFLQGVGDTVVYRYFDVPLNTWKSLMAAKSHGSFAFHNINHTYRYERCLEPNRPYNPMWRFESEKQLQELYKKA
jgi:hypothetical protein